MTDGSEFRRGQHAARYRKQLLVFHADVPAVQALQRDEVVPKRPRVARRQRSVPQPSAPQRVDGVVVILGDAVICFEPFDHPDRGLGLRVTRRAEPGEEALLLVRGVPQKDRPKVVQSCGERFAIGFRERSSPPTVGDGHKPREQPFDPPGPSLNGPNGASTP